MKFTMVAAAISVACLFAFFHSCHSILCYKCHSKNYENKKCETISDDSDYLFDFTEYVENCMKMVVYKHDAKNGTTERFLRRSGYKSFYEHMILADISKHKRKGFQVDFNTCTTDRCNND